MRRRSRIGYGSGWRYTPIAAAIAHPLNATPLLGQSPAVVAVRHTVAQVANTNLTVLLQGESGTGKEVVARLLGAQSGRAAGFVKINCAAIPNELWESELFGYEPGAFTGANRRKSGKFELAEGGTMFLDEISETPLHLQAKLLQVLQDGEFSRLGGHRTRSVDVRVLAASNVDLRAAVEAGAFRRDLYYRLNVIAIVLPPLWQRTEDIPLLTEYFVDKYARAYQRAAPALSSEVAEALERHSWPGNIRELENFVKRLVILGDAGARIGELLEAVPATEGAPARAVAAITPGPAAARADGSLLEIGRRAAWAAEREALLAALAATRWNRRQAARQLKISYKSLQNKLRTLRAERPAA